QRVRQRGEVRGRWWGRLEGHGQRWGRLEARGRLRLGGSLGAGPLGGGWLGGGGLGGGRRRLGLGRGLAGRDPRRPLRRGRRGGGRRRGRPPVEPGLRARGVVELRQEDEVRRRGRG